MLFLTWGTDKEIAVVFFNFPIRNGYSESLSVFVAMNSLCIWGVLCPVCSWFFDI